MTNDRLARTGATSGSESTIAASGDTAASKIVKAKPAAMVIQKLDDHSCSFCSGQRTREIPIPASARLRENITKGMAIEAMP